MFVKEFNLGIDYKKYGIKKPSKEPQFTGYILKNYDEFSKGRKRPAVIILPGGGYKFTSFREATPVATQFLSADISSFVLHYTCMPDDFYPLVFIEVYKAIEMIRDNADKWNIDKDKIYLCGFSAGGHLAGACGTLWNSDMVKPFGFTGEKHKPNGLVLAYPVINYFKELNQYINSIPDENIRNQVESVFHLDKLVSKDTPKTFLWATDDDTNVPVSNSIDFAQALVKNNIPMELHIYPKGDHGLSIADESVCAPEDIIEKVSTWVGFAKKWIKNN